MVRFDGGISGVVDRHIVDCMIFDNLEFKRMHADDFLASIVSNIKIDNYLISLDDIVTLFYSSGHFDLMELIAYEHSGSGDCVCQHTFLMKHAENVVERYPIIASLKISVSDRSRYLLDDYLIKYSFLAV